MPESAPIQVVKLFTQLGVLEVYSQQDVDALTKEILASTPDPWIHFDAVRLDERGHIIGPANVSIKREDVRSFMVFKFIPPSQLSVMQQTGMGRMPS